VNNSAARQRPLPPFGNQIDSESDLILCYCGPRAWRLASPSAERVASLVFPIGRDPSEYRWPVSGRSVLVLTLGQPRTSVDFLVIELLRAGADTVYLDTGSGDLLAYKNPGAVCAP